MSMKAFLKPRIILLLIFFTSLLLRTYGLNWDQNQHLHPDERFLTMVATDISLPDTKSSYFDTTTSPLNPYNYPQYPFFVYGTFPLFLVKYLGVLLNLNNYNHLALLGRFLSAIFDSFNIITLFFLAKKLFPFRSKIIFLPSILYAFTVLPIQLSHFWAVDTFLTTFLLLTFTLLIYQLYPFAALTFGLALTCKISALYFVPIIGIFLLYKIISTKKIFPVLLITVYSLLITFIIFRIFQPYVFTSLFSINNKFIDNIIELSRQGQPNSFFPPAIQWISKTPIVFPFQNVIFWGIGLPLSLSCIYLFLRYFTKIIKPSNRIIYATVSWILLLFFYQGSQFTHAMRYFLPIYPFIIFLLVYLLSFQKKISKIFYLIIALHLIYGLSMLSVYSHSHTRIQASSWIYQNVPAGSNISNEYWDDALPLNLSLQNPNIYNFVQLPMFDPDSVYKWSKLNPKIDSLNYLILSSNRVWGSIPKVPSIYPQTTKFYNDLFAGKLAFKKIVEFNSYPGFSLPFIKKCYYFGYTDYPGIKNSFFKIDNNCLFPGIYFRDDTAEEAFTVYDHPQVIIFKKI